MKIRLMNEVFFFLHNDEICSATFLCVQNRQSISSVIIITKKHGHLTIGHYNRALGLLKARLGRWCKNCNEMQTLGLYQNSYNMLKKAPENVHDGERNNRDWHVLIHHRNGFQARTTMAMGPPGRQRHESALTVQYKLWEAGLKNCLPHVGLLLTDQSHQYCLAWVRQHLWIIRLQLEGVMTDVFDICQP